MIIFVDMDNVITDFNKSFVEFYSKIFNKKIKYEKEKFTKKYDIIDSLLENSNYFFKRFVSSSIFNTPTFWLNMEPIKGAIDSLEKLIKKEHDVYIVTTPIKNNINCVIEKTFWIKNNLPFFNEENIIFCHKKELLVGDVLIEDNPKNLKKSKCKYLIAMDYGYNRDVKVDLRAKNWEDIIKFIENNKK